MYSKLKPQGERIGCVRSSQNLTKFFFFFCPLLFPLEEVGHRLQKSPHFLAVFIFVTLKRKL